MIMKNLKNLKKNERGQMRVIETIIASFIIVAALGFVSTFAVSPTSLGYEMTDLEKTGYSVLHDLDQHGLLLPLVYGGNWSDLRAILKMTLPNDVYFNMTIYDVHGVKLQGNPDVLILHGDSDTFSDAKNVASLTYCLVGTGVDEPIYNPRILVLQLTRG
jgi:hypothetical protein